MKKKLFTALQRNFTESVTKKTPVRLANSPNKTKTDPTVPPAKHCKPAVPIPKTSKESLNKAGCKVDDEANSSEFHYWVTFLDALWAEPNRTVNSWPNAYNRYSRNCTNNPDCPPPVSKEKFTSWRYLISFYHT